MRHFISFINSWTNEKRLTFTQKRFYHRVRVCLVSQHICRMYVPLHPCVSESYASKLVGTSGSKCVKVLKHCLPRTSSVRYVIVEVETFHLHRLQAVSRAQMVLKSWNLQKRYFTTHKRFFSEINNKKDTLLCPVLMYAFLYIRVWANWMYIVWTGLRPLCMCLVLVEVSHLTLLIMWM